MQDADLAVERRQHLTLNPVRSSAMAIARRLRLAHNPVHHEDLPSDQGDFRHLTRPPIAFGRRARLPVFTKNPGRPSALRGFLFSAVSSLSSTMRRRTYDKLIATIPARRTCVRARPRSGSRSGIPPFPSRR